MGPGCSGRVTRSMTTASGGTQKGGQKITIPSDLRFHSQALSGNVGNSCELPVAKIRGPWRAEPLRVPATTLKFRVAAKTPCGISTLNAN